MNKWGDKPATARNKRTRRNGSAALKPLLWAALLLPVAVEAVDLDVALSERARQTEVAPSCATLRRPRQELDTPASYRKGICLLYGVGGKADSDAGLNLLRRAAEAGYTEAQVALGDRLQAQDDSASQKEALAWYQRAQTGGDARAGGRYVRLSQRIAAAGPAELDQPPPGTIVDPSFMEMQKLYGAGYHCHRMRNGQRWCHDVVD